VVKVQHTVTHRRQIVHVDRLMPCEIQSQPEPQTVELEALVEHQVSEDVSEDNGLLNSFPTPSVSLPPVTTRSRRAVRKPARLR